MSLTEQLGRERRNSIQISNRNTDLGYTKIDRKEILLSEIKENKELLHTVLVKTKGPIEQTVSRPSKRSSKKSSRKATARTSSSRPKKTSSLKISTWASPSGTTVKVTRGGLVGAGLGGARRPARVAHQRHQSQLRALEARNRLQKGALEQAHEREFGRPSDRRNCWTTRSRTTTSQFTKSASSTSSGTLSISRLKL